MPNVFINNSLDPEGDKKVIQNKKREKYKYPPQIRIYPIPFITLQLKSNSTYLKSIF
tara:strand:+ start:363 stop:533 length:171 start_codon:yes stop_codon:yes gene_type:complete